jgi:hypothetical protein
MSTISIRLPEELKTKAVLLAQKKKISLNELVKYWLQTAVVQEETMEWMKSRLHGKNPELLIAEFGKFLEKTKPGPEPTLEELQRARGE